jgi:hypothetical protein
LAFTGRSEEPPRSVTRAGQKVSIIVTERDFRDGEVMALKWLSNLFPGFRIINPDNGVFGRRSFAGRCQQLVIW